MGRFPVPSVVDRCRWDVDSVVESWESLYSSRSSIPLLLVVRFLSRTLLFRRPNGAPEDRCGENFSPTFEGRKRTKNNDHTVCVRSSMFCYFVGRNCPNYSLLDGFYAFCHYFWTRDLDLQSSGFSPVCPLCGGVYEGVSDGRCFLLSSALSASLSVRQSVCLLTCQSVCLSGCNASQVFKEHVYV